MPQVIVYKNENGNVSVCIPTGELPIQEVLTKDCPLGAIIVEDSTLPQGDDAKFFDAWEMDAQGKVTVNLDKAKAIYMDWFNKAAIEAAQTRQNHTFAGIPNNGDDVTWQQKVTVGRSSIKTSSSTSELLAITLPTA